MGDYTKIGDSLYSMIRALAVLCIVLFFAGIGVGWLIWG